MAIRVRKTTKFVLGAAIAATMSMIVAPAALAHSTGDGAPAHTVQSRGCVARGPALWGWAGSPGLVKYSIYSGVYGSSYQAQLQRWNPSLGRWVAVQSTGWWYLGGTGFAVGPPISEGMPAFQVDQAGYYRAQVQLYFPSGLYHPSGTWHTLPHCFVK